MRIETVADLEDPRVAEYRHVQDPAWLAARGLFVAEGLGVVRALLGAPRHRARSLLGTAAGVARLRDVVPADGPSIYVASLATVSAIVGFGFHGGWLAVGERGAPLPLADLLTNARRVVVLDRVANPDNVGGVFRNAAAFGADAVLLAPGSGDPLYRKALRVSMGAALAVPFASLAAWPGDLARLRAAGFTLVALTPRPGAIDVAELAAAPPARAALLVGTEGAGLGPDVLAAADVAVRIPMAPGVDSLNLSTATAIVLHRLAER